MPVNEDDDEDEADLELGQNLSVLYHLTPRIMTLLELDAVHVYGGEEDGVEVLNLTPGFKIQPSKSQNLQVGAGISFPLTDEKEFHARAIVSVFYHF